MCVTLSVPTERARALHGVRGVMTVEGLRVEGLAVAGSGEEQARDELARQRARHPRHIGGRVAVDHQGQVSRLAPLVDLDAERAQRRDPVRHRSGLQRWCPVEAIGTGKGVGRALIAACESYFRTLKLRSMMIGVLAKNANAKRAYLAAGFSPYSEQLQKML